MAFLGIFFFEISVDLNRNVENIGARRLRAVVSKIIEELSFDAPDMDEKTFVITADYVTILI